MVSTSPHPGRGRLPVGSRTGLGPGQRQIIVRSMETGMSESSSSQRNPVEELAEEFLERCRCGERPTLTEYTNRYPELADQIRRLFPLLIDMEAARPTPHDGPS